MEKYTLRNPNTRVSFTTRIGLIGAGVGLATLALAGCAESYTEDGHVVTGANGKNYALPNDAERPVYKTQKACESDVEKQIKKLEKSQDVKIGEKAVDLCQPTSLYHPVLYPGWYYGPIISRSLAWKSDDVAEWQKEIPSRSFAADGEPVQKSLHVAPEGSKPGSKVTITEDGSGFGEDPHSYTGGGPVEHPVEPVEPHPIEPIEPHISVK